MSVDEQGGGPPTPPGGPRVPEGVYPSLTYADPLAAIEFLCEGFGFTKRLVVPAEDGGVMHSELSLGNAVVMVSGNKPDQHRTLPDPGGVPVSLSVYVADPDAHHARAVAAGATIVRELVSEEYGARGYLCRDPGGHVWYFSDYVPGSWWED